MRVNVHDFSGHPFQVELSRELASRGHSVLHTYASQYVTGHGRLTVTDQDPDTLRIEPIRVKPALAKYSPVRRVRYEVEYAAAWRAKLEQSRYDLVVACNVPLFALARMQPYFRAADQRWLLWHQDLYSLGVAAEARRRLPGTIAPTLCRRVQAMERSQVAQADGVVAITDEMVTQYRAWGVRSDHVTVRPNWAPVDEIVPIERDNAWARENGMPTDKVRLLYAGTLGRKHNPSLLLKVLDAVQARGVDAVLVVASEGEGADVVRAQAAGRPDVRVVGFQPAERFSEVLSSADCVLTLLEPDASRFSVPSKVLSYLSAGRPIAALMPQDNPAAHDVRAAGGVVVPPSDTGVETVAQWISFKSCTAGAFDAIGAKARALAERRFDIGAIADEFEVAFERAAFGRELVRQVAVSGGR